MKTKTKIKTKIKTTPNHTTRQCNNSNKKIERNGTQRKANIKEGQEEGLVEEYWENGQLKIKANVEDDVINLEEYSLKGQLNRKGNYKGSKKEGLWEIYYLDNGQLMEKVNYKNGKQNGLWESYHKNGQLKSKGKFKDDVMDGIWEFYKKDGSFFLTETWKNGVKQE